MVKPSATGYKLYAFFEFLLSTFEFGIFSPLHSPFVESAPQKFLFGFNIYLVNIGPLFASYIWKERKKMISRVLEIINRDQETNGTSIALIIVEVA